MKETAAHVFSSKTSRRGPWRFFPGTDERVGRNPVRNGPVSCAPAEGSATPSTQPGRAGAARASPGERGRRRRAHLHWCRAAGVGAAWYAWWVRCGNQSPLVLVG
jgi:hypothetical protein